MKSGNGRIESFTRLGPNPWRASQGFTSPARTFASHYSAPTRCYETGQAEAKKGEGAGFRYRRRGV